MSDPDRSAGQRVQWALVAAASVLVGAGLFAFSYARGASYLTDEPEACINCHVMRPHYAAWQKSSHHAVAVCNDCHTPDGVVGKYATKASSGLLHVYAFTTGRFPDEIRIHPRSVGVVEGACGKCHGAIVDSMGHGGRSRDERPCLDCHRGVGHSEG